ncbi:MAG: pyrimidine 5'-nucleotidase [Pseudomonadota bacterium]
MKQAFSHIDTWVFDLDNTLYPSRSRLFDQIDVRMGAFISDFLQVDRVEARRIQKQFFFEHGTTLRGLMLEHKVEPDDFLGFVHDIDHSVLDANPALDGVLGRLPGRKVIFTSGTVAHAEAVMGFIGIGHHFEEIFDIKSADYLPKPHRSTYDRFVEELGVAPRRAAMFEDIIRNLEAPHDLGMVTVLVHDNDNEDGAMINKLNDDTGDAEHVHHVTDDLAAFLAQIAPE